MKRGNELTEERAVGCPRRRGRIRPQARKVHRLNLSRDSSDSIAALCIVVDEEGAVKPLWTLIVGAARLVGLLRRHVSRARTVIRDQVPDPVGQVLLIPDARPWKGSPEGLGGSGLCRVVVEDVLNSTVRGAAGRMKGTN